MISVISIDEKDRWDKIVKSFSNYDVNYLSDYASAFQISGEGEPMLIYYTDEKGKAINVVMKRDIALANGFQGKLEKNKWFDISTPYGYGGFWGEKCDLKDADEEYIKFCKEQGFVSEFVRFHLFSDYREKFIGKVESKTHNIVRLLDIDLDEMMMDFEHKVRKNLKRANKFDLQIELDYNQERLQDFFKIYYETMERNDAEKKFYFSKSFFKYMNSMKNNYVYFYVLYKEEVIATELVLYGSENCYSFLGGTNNEFFDYRPNDFLKVEIIKWAKQRGLKRFILGGGYGEDDGIFKYKKSFAPKGIYNFYIGKRIFNDEKYKLLSDIRRENTDLIDNEFFPVYRQVK